MIEDIVQPVIVAATGFRLPYYRHVFRGDVALLFLIGILRQNPAVWLAVSETFKTPRIQSLKTIRAVGSLTGCPTFGSTMEP